jgi:hypothetical protein
LWPIIKSAHDRPRRWTAIVNEAMDERALEDLRTSVDRGRPWGEAAWVQETARRLGLLFTLRNPGRPRKQTTNQQCPLCVPYGTYGGAADRTR